MAVTKNPVLLKDFIERKLFSQRANLAANAGSSEIFSFPLPTNRQAIIRGIVRCTSGAVGPRIAAVDAVGTDLLTAVAHGIVTGTPVYVGAVTTQPTGVSATTMYFARAASVDTISLHLTQAAAVAGTGLVDITVAGVGTFIQTTVQLAAYDIFGCVANKNGNVALVGSNTVVVAEDVAGWDCTVTADNTNKALRVNVTPDTVLACVIEAHVEIYDEPLGLV